MKVVVAVVGSLIVIGFVVISYGYVRSVAAAANADPHLLWLWPLIIAGPMPAAFLALLVRGQLRVRLCAGIILAASASGTAVADCISIRAGGSPRLSLLAAVGVSALPPITGFAMLYLMLLLVTTRRGQ